MWSFFYVHRLTEPSVQLDAYMRRSLRAATNSIECPKSNQRFNRATEYCLEMDLPASFRRPANQCQQRLFFRNCLPNLQIPLPVNKGSDLSSRIS